MDLMDFILIHDKNNQVKRAITNVLSENIKDKNIDIELIIQQLTNKIVDVVEIVVEDGYEVSCGYASNVRRDIENEIHDIFKKTFIISQNK